MDRRLHRRARRVLLAICGVGGANATKDATRANIEASNTWAFFQAKNIRRTAFGLAADELELMLAAQPGMPDEAKRNSRTRSRTTATQYRSLTTDPRSRKAWTSCSSRPRRWRLERDVALRKDPYFDWSQALLQIAIVLASVHLIIGNARTSGPQRRPRRPGHAADAERIFSARFAPGTWLSANPAIHRPRPPATSTVTPVM